jgi:hypothetical protein
LTKEDNPSQITSIYGRKFTKKESIKIKRDIDFFLNKASRFVPTEIDINHGDLIWNGEGVTIVAIS